MASRKKKGKLPARIPVMPYTRAMKAYAYANKPFGYAMRQLGYLYLETPREDVKSHSLYWNLLEGMYKDYRLEARRLSRDFSFSNGQIAILGLDPFYTWILEDENPSASSASAFTQDIIDDMRNFRLRQIVSVLLRLGETPESIHQELQKLGFTNWMVEHINFYTRFFWDTARMKYEDWLTYLYFTNPYSSQRTDEEGVLWRANPHFSYLKDMVTMQSAESLRYKCGLPLKTSLSEMERDIQLNLGQMIKESMRTGDCRNTAKLLSPFNKMTALQNSGDSNEINDEIREAMNALTIIATPHQAKTHGIDMADLGYQRPLNRDEIEGEISDPRLPGPGPKPPVEK